MAGPNSYRKGKRKKEQSWIFCSAPGTHLSPSWFPPARAVGGAPGWLYLRHHWRCLPPSWLQRVQVSAMQWAPPNQPPLYHSSSASHSVIPSINFTDDYLENRKVWMAFSVILFLIYILPTPSSLIWENTRKGDPTASLCLVPLPGGHAHCPCHRSCLGDRLNHSNWAKKMAHQCILYLCLKVLSKKL